MKITSSSFENGERIPKKFTADGRNINPELIISEISPKAKSLILICEDPDARRVVGFPWIHWVVFNIHVGSNRIIIKENTLPGVPGESSYRKPEYLGPNPPMGSGIHNYHFKIYALDTKLDLPKMVQLKEIKKSMKDHLIEESDFIGQYSRDQ